MNENEINELASKGFFHSRPLRGKLEETHISWVILTRKNAFKLKKPLKLSFLDFSTLPLRKHFCRREVALNSRFTDIYQGVVPIRKHSGKLCIGNGEGKVIDYAVQMKRLMVAKRMDNVLRRRKVNTENINSLAGVIAAFHSKAEIVDAPFHISKARKTFNDIYLIREFVREHLGLSYAGIIDQSILWSNGFLKTHGARIQQRIDHGFNRDVHGDLHGGNIFLYRKPVLFDCIEFNDQYRQIDVLYEVAFLCMDLEGFHQRHLSKSFMSAYTKSFPCFEVKEDESIFVYFKCLRANVRAKVHVMSAMQMHNEEKIKYHADEARKYLTLMKVYMT